MKRKRNNVLNNKQLFQKNEEIIGDKQKDIVLFESIGSIKDIGSGNNRKGAHNLSLK